MQNTFDAWLKDPARVYANTTVFTLLVYYFFIEQDFNRFFYLLNNTRNVEL